jgi:subtilisin family serine protease
VHQWVTKRLGQRDVDLDVAAFDDQVDALTNALRQVVHRAPKALEERFRQLGAVAYVEQEGAFERMAPVIAQEVTPSELEDLTNENSVSFIGAARVHAEVTVPGADGTAVPVDGRGVKVGVIDTGIDYTHAMFGGAGTEQAYTDNDPNAVEDGSFPTAKVVGGIDLVGTAFNSAARRSSAA